MARSYASTMIDAPADDVWARIRDFNGLATWHSGLVTHSEIEDGLAGDQVGGVRSFTLGDGTHIRERLLSHSDLERSYTYNFEKTPFDVDNYCATIRVTNASGVAKKPRVLRFRLVPSVAMTSSWNGTVKRTADVVDVTLPTWVATLAPGAASSDFGFCTGGTTRPTQPTAG